MARRRDWPNIIEKLNTRPRRLRFDMGSPGSAQVTRCRLLNEWNNLEAWTVGQVLYLQLAS
ncbi:MAG: hypothetical protein GY725_12375 [bacterium]|nr:hypothetical protein [bacterium]